MKTVVQQNPNLVLAGSPNRVNEPCDDCLLVLLGLAVGLVQGALDKRLQIRVYSVADSLGVTGVESD